MTRPEYKVDVSAVVMFVGDAEGTLEFQHLIAEEQS